jgi:hypothetical protein
MDATSDGAVGHSKELLDDGSLTLGCCPPLPLLLSSESEAGPPLEHAERAATSNKALAVADVDTPYETADFEAEEREEQLQPQAVGGVMGLGGFPQSVSDTT